MIWLLCVVAGTLAPFGFAPGVSMEQGLKLFEYGAFERDPIHFLLNVLLYMPLGVLLYYEGQRRSIRMLPIAILAGVVGLSLSTTIEYLQAFMPARDSSLIDVLANTVGSLVGVAAGRRWAAPTEARLIRLREGTSSTMLVGMVASFLMAALLMSGTLQARTRLSNWSAEYPLLIGNEQTGDRPWRGRVFALGITDAATPAAAVRRFAAGESIVLPGAEIATFDFNGGTSYKDRSGNLPGLEWAARPSSSTQPGVRLSGTSWLHTTTPASGLGRRLRQTNAFTLRVRCATDDTNQDGPARIVSNSVSPYLRNFTLGQQGSDLVFRLRTPDTGVNGYPLEIYVPGVFAERHTRDILATYDGATLRLAMAHGDDVSSTKLTPGTSVALAIPTLHVRRDELQMYELAYLAALSAVPGALIGFFSHTNRERVLFSAGWVLAFAVLLEATTVRVSGSSFSWADVAQNAGVAAVVLTVFNAIFANADMPWRPSAHAHVDLSPRDALEYQPR
jgi:hypothetical protein